MAAQVGRLTLRQPTGLSDFPVVEEAGAARQRPQRDHTTVVLDLTVGTS